MKLRWYAWVGIAVLALLALLGGAIVWLLNTGSGARWAFARANGFLGDALQVARIEGTLAGPLTLTGIAYRDPNSGLDVKAEHVHVDIALRELFGMTVHVVTAELRGIDVSLGEAQEAEPPPQTDEPFTLEAPIDVIVDRFVLRDAQIARGGEPLLALDSATFAGQWIGSALAVRQLDVRSPQGEINFQADVRQSRYYEGQGRGRFRWSTGERELAGSLEAHGRDATANLRVDFTAPFAAQLAVELQQLEDLPWKLTLDVPMFDPREGLMPDSSLQSLAATLNGAGSLREGTIAGVLELNGEEIRIDRVQYTRQEEMLDLDSLVHFGGGTFAAKGALRTTQEPVSADMNVNWSEIVVPETLAGQEIFTRGNIDFAGSAERYRATGTMSFGPSKRIADVELALEGTPQRVQVEQLDIVQKPGRFALNGAVDLQPHIAWSLRAQARQFDPGAFATQWPGSLSFDLATDGTMAEGQPQGTLTVSNLRGRLRNRDLGGRVDLALQPDWVIAGDLDLTSGRSRIQLVGRRGEEMDAVATLDIPAMNDWLPDGSGELHGRITASGRWPELDVAGQLNGNALRVGTTLQADTVAVRFNVHKPTEPSGEAMLEGTNIVASGFELATLRTQVGGDMQRHTLDFVATGAPLAASFLVDGSLDGEAWSGTIQRLVLDVQDAARLTLQQPVQLAYSPERVQMSQACFVDREIRLCMQGNRASSGEMHAVYSLQNVPLGLANTFASADLPLRFDGTIDGAGDIESTAEGVFKGRADLRSASGRISRQHEDADVPPDVLLAYADFNLSAELSGADANARVSARLDDTGSLNGQVALRGLAETTTNLEGDASLSLPSLRAIEVFAPQLANVQGRVDLRGNVSGTLDQPQIDGELRVSELGMDVPMVGLELRSGTLSVTPVATDRFRVVGGMTSGPGRIEFQGEATTAGAVEMRVAGKQFQAADIPSANVLIDPDLQFQRVPERMTLTGAVHIPRAAIDVQKLPRNRSTQGLSADVVIIDAETTEAEQAEAMPLSADIKVSLGDEVTLVGFGLDARVQGELTVQERPGSPTTGSGEVRVDGTYKAYGQDLTIRQGRLLFASSPLDNPRLNIVAVREIEPPEGDKVIAGLNVSGYAQSPQLTVFSEPAMAQSDALAYLVTGRPMSEVGQGEGDGDMLQSAARSLGAAAGGLLAKNIGRRLGVDEIGVEDDEAIGGAALTVGQYLSPRLFVSYGVGLFEPGEVITLRYRLSRSLALEALNGPQGSRAGLEFRKER